MTNTAYSHYHDVLEVINITYLLDGRSVLGAIEELNNIHGTHGDVALGVSVLEDSYGVRHAQVSIHVKRPETEAEKTDRLAREEHFERRQRATYEKLKEKFGE